MKVRMVRAENKEASIVSDILREAARYLDSIGQTLRRGEALSPDNVAKVIDSGLFFLARMDGESLGTLMFQLEDRYSGLTFHGAVQPSFIDFLWPADDRQ